MASYLEERKSNAYGKALLVPSVQELVKDFNLNVPSRYIRPDQPLISDDDHALNFPDLQIPVIDFQRLVSNESNSELEKFHLACKEWGFFQLVNHGVKSSLVEKTKTEVQNLFKLPMEEKKKYWRSPGDMEGFGHNFVFSEKQKLDWSDVFTLITLPIDNPKLVAELPSNFRESMGNYSMELNKLASGMMAQMEKALKLKKKEVTKLFEGGRQICRLNYYPPCPQPEKVIGLTPHSDGSGLTIVLQIGDVEGLQVKKNGKWVTVKPLPNAFIVNIGDILEMVTNGEYHSNEHRATTNSQKERISIVTFCNPNFGVEIGPAHSLITDQTPEKYRRLPTHEYYSGFFSRELDSKSYMESMKI